MLVRLHAVRAWLSRRLDEATIEVGEAALALQEMMQEEAVETRPRRIAHLNDSSSRTISARTESACRVTTTFERLRGSAIHLRGLRCAYSGERVLVEYYLTLEELVLQSQEQVDQTEDRSPWLMLCPMYFIVLNMLVRLMRNRDSHERLSAKSEYLKAINCKIRSTSTRS